MARVHRITHPILGVATWSEMRAAVKRIREETGRKVCLWCHKAISKGRRTRCGNAHCGEMIWQSWDPARPIRVALRANKHCPCGALATEVDHRVPVSLGGTGDQSNLLPLCHECHRKATALLRKEKAAYKARMEPVRLPIFGGWLERGHRP